jgi:hypothetical protein
MRVLAVATILLLSSAAGPSLAQQDKPNAPAQSQSQTGPDQSPPQTVPVQPERTPQQSEQARKEEGERGEDVRIRDGWRAGERDNHHMDRIEQSKMGRMMGHMGRMDPDDMARMMEMCDRMMGRADSGMRHDRHDLDRDRNEAYSSSDSEERDQYVKNYHDDDRSSRRVKICIEEENGDQYCRYRR